MFVGFYFCKFTAKKSKQIQITQLSHFRHLFTVNSFLKFTEKLKLKLSQHYTVFNEIEADSIERPAQLDLSTRVLQNMTHNSRT